MSSTADEEFMRIALAAAVLGPAADPNPQVGAAITDASGHLVAVGHHRGSGTPHAEIGALIQAGTRARGGTLYVTLEPCRHRGRTGPCTEALIGAGISRVVFAQDDPTEQAGGGAQVLAEAGVEVESGVLAEEAMALNAFWSWAMYLGRPVVTWKYAATLDGRSAAVDGTSQWITGEEARADVHERRSQCGAIVVGTGTALADDPQLTVRDTYGALTGQQPYRVVVGHRDLPEDARLRDGSAPTLFLHTHDPAQVLAELHEREIRHVWLEGGPTLAGAFLDAGLVDEVVAYVAPMLLGAGPSALVGPQITTLAEAYRLDLQDVARVGDDIRLVLNPVV
ncbi:bifunctional diaminohydroxyphosphoribosylaminopyrimidine deaminase/5-amino-6-(5-phosphoribosylamino)uracil reductase RibD [Austwickia chelonae]|uniref:bifunctional diaminohydroxyphosphoribosylaminopyrimidine deaminase/5-amino-6-(5-phosphoribosylamino)uracil reductase RibD n=1 Tax=Austwickia chelonae TaxID=100225 RepID=UPI000E2700BF|nr:bifunctional diaminohydroxyphosphoribosylaminopyrimidine deaminase/5-amino-6-(5-phosphoribosylamino)uracil reductase RibD [Austwickia chelonae]